jgi:flagellar protein FlbT
MALVIDLKAGERVVIGQALITNDGPRTRLRIAGSAPILREKDFLAPDEAVSPCQKLYVLVQAMYLDPAPQRLHGEYFDLQRVIQRAAPSMVPRLLEINQKIIAGSYYKALKDVKKLIDHEQRLISHA